MNSENENESDNVGSRLAKMKAEAEWRRANPDNPVCRGCNRRELPDRIDHNFCGECRDTIILLKSGCRFGKAPCCGNEDCKMPLDPDEERIAIMWEQNPKQFDWLEMPQ